MNLPLPASRFGARYRDNYDRIFGSAPSKSNLIEAELALVERTHGVRVLYAVESGSRVWGFASPDSDWDVRFVYLKPLAWHTSVFDRRDVVEMPPHDDLDCTGWELSKVMRALYKGNPQLFEWLYSPVVYRGWDRLPELRRLAGGFFNHRSAIYHYLHMADGNYRTYLREGREDGLVWLKKYLYVVRPLLCCHWIQDKGGVPPVDIDELVAGVPAAVEAIRPDLEGLLAEKRAGGELGYGTRRLLLNHWIEGWLDYFGKSARTGAKRAGSGDDLDAFLLRQLLPEVR